MSVAIERTTIRSNIQTNGGRNAEVGIHNGIHFRFTIGICYQLSELVPVVSTPQHVILFVADKRLFQTVVVGHRPQWQQPSEERQ